MKTNINTWKAMVIFGKRRIMQKLVVMSVTSRTQDSVPISFVCISINVR